MPLTTSDNKPFAYHSQPTELPLLLTPTQVAKELSVHRTTVYELIKSGELPAVPYGPRRYMVKRDDLLAYVRGAESIKHPESA